MQPQAKPHDGLSKYDYWTQHLAQWQESGISQSEYRAKHGLNQHVFSYWKKKLKSKKQPASLVPVTIQPDSLQNQRHNSPESTSGLSIRFCGGIRLDIEEHFNSDTLRRVMSVIGSM